MLFILQLCKPPSVFFSLPPLNGVSVYIQIYSCRRRFIISFNFQIQALIRAQVHFTEGFFFFFFEQHKHLVSNTFSADDPLSEYSSPLIDWLRIDLCRAVLQIHFRNSSSAVCLDLDYVLNLIILKMLAKCHSFQTILRACNVF